LSKKKKLLPVKPVEVIGPHQTETFNGELHRPDLFDSNLLSIKKTKKSMPFRLVVISIGHFEPTNSSKRNELNESL